MKKLVLFTLNEVIDKTLEHILTANFDSRIIVVSRESNVTEVVSKANPDIILVMVDAALQDDYKILKVLQAKKTLLPASIMVVAKSSPNDEEIKCLDYGVLDFIIPPFNDRLIVNHIEKCTAFKETIDLKELEYILKRLPSNIFLKDAEGKYVFCTHYWHHLHGANEPGWTIRGKTDLEIRKDTANAKLAMEKDKEIIRSGKGTHYVIEVNADNTQEFLEIIKEPVNDDQGNIYGIVALINNVTEQELLKRKLRKMSITDELTGLYNRTYLHEVLNELDQNDVFPIGFISADCNYLKQINDYYGHLMGDEYIRLVGVLFKMVLPETSQFFRTGGDEFLAILPKTTENQLVEYIRVMKEKAQMLQIRGRHFSVAFGYSCMAEKGGNVMKYLESADNKMYTDKGHRDSRNISSITTTTA